MSTNDKNDANRDPITGAPGAHPVGTGIGAAAGGAAGAAIGSVAGPIGTAVGGIVGAVAGGLGGKGVGEAVNPTAEAAYWRDNYANEPYHDKQYQFADYEPAYRTGYEDRVLYRGKTFDQAEDSLRSNYESRKGSSQLGWDKAKGAVKAAWNRVERATPGDFDGDGR